MFHSVMKSDNGTVVDLSSHIGDLWAQCQGVTCPAVNGVRAPPDVKVGPLRPGPETAPWRPILNADRRGPVLIGECTSDIGVHVHRNAIFDVRASAPLCGCLSYSCGTAAGAATPLRSFRPKKGATPPFGMPRSASGRAAHVHAHATLPRRGRSRSSIPPGRVPEPC